jgi:hypothetical protein
LLNIAYFYQHIYHHYCFLVVKMSIKNNWLLS